MDITDQTEHAPAETQSVQDEQTEPTAVFFADPRAAVLLLDETITSLVAKYGIRHAYIDLSTIPGLSIATTFLKLGLPYSELSFGQEAPEMPHGIGVDKRFKPNRPRTMADLPHLRHQAAGQLTVPVEELGTLDANLVTIPAMADERNIDFSKDTLVGEVLTQAESNDRDLLVIAPPEKGLRPVNQQPGDVNSGDFERLTLLVRVE